jgi:hypothetical protein
MGENLGKDGSKVGVFEDTLASAATCDLGSKDYLRINITGTTTITSFGTTANRLRILRFSGVLTLTHNATTLILPGAVNIVTAAGDIAIVASDASGNWRCLNYFRADAGLESMLLALSDETTVISAATSVLTIRMPYAVKLVAVRSSVNTASSSGLVTVDINEGGTSILSTKLSIDASEKTSQTAATAAVISDPDLADDAEITFDIDAAGTGAKGLKVLLLFRRV